MIDNGDSFARASCIDGKECRCDEGGSFSSSTIVILGRDSVGEMNPPWLMTELVAGDGYEYGGGGPEYMFDGLMRGGIGMFRAVDTGRLWV